jgi:hypothetical protein
MSWRVYADRYVTADFSGAPTKWQAFTPPNDIALKAIRSWFVFFNNPSMTDIRMRIYSFKGSTVRQLLHTSDENLTKAEILTENYGHRDIYCGFTNAPYLKGGDTYALVPWITGYTGDADSHVAWTKNFPTLVYDHTPDLNGVTDLYDCPYDFTIIGANL